MPTTLTVPVPEGFRLRSVVFSHGWYDLPPFVWNADQERLETAVTLGGIPLDLTIRQLSPAAVQVRSSSTVRRTERDELATLVADMLGLRFDLAPFYSGAGKRFAWARELNVGRFLRGGSAFEDVVKMLATTNCSWSLTKIMIARMVDLLGAVTPEGRRAFPSPTALAKTDLAFFRNEIRAGYRAEYFQLLASRAASGELDVESWPRHTGEVGDLAKLIRAEKGCGPYVVENLCRLFGRFDGLGIDSWCRRKFVELFGESKGDVDAAIRAKYRRFGNWQGLALWLDLTKDWHVGDNSRG
jgi:3-methyladenine DNA glycosylase/8-oxoguanine DNA glycosylase